MCRVSGRSQFNLLGNVGRPGRELCSQVAQRQRCCQECANLPVLNRQGVGWPGYVEKHMNALGVTKMVYTGNHHQSAPSQS